MATYKDQTALTPKQQRAILALLSEPTIIEAALSTGIGERTLHTWLSEPVFSEAYRVACKEAFGQSIASLQRASSDAVKVLVEVMSDTAGKGATRIMAAKTILELAIKGMAITTPLNDHQNVSSLEQSMPNDYQQKLEALRKQKADLKKVGG